MAALEVEEVGLGRTASAPMQFGCILFVWVT